MKLLVLLMAAIGIGGAVASTVSFNTMTITIPDGWRLEFSVIYEKSGAKVGELVSKNSWPYSSGEEFVKSFKNGFVDDPDTTEFITSGSIDGLYWVCRSGEYHDGKGGSGIWYSRIFWARGPLVIFYSTENCEEKFIEAVEIARTLREK